MFHGPGQRYISHFTGRCKRLIVQAVHPKPGNLDRQEIGLGENTPMARRLAFWLVSHFPTKLEHVPVWLVHWVWFTFALIWPSTIPNYTGEYPAYLSRYHGQLWAARSPREYCLRNERSEADPVPSVREITHSPYPLRLVIYDSASSSWNICDNKNIIKQQKYVAISYRYDDIVPNGANESTRLSSEEAFIAKVEAIMASIGESAYWIDLKLVERTSSAEETNKDLYLMADVYRSAEFTLIMFSPPAGVTEEEAFERYGERLWSLPEALLSRQLRYKFRDGEVTSITLHQLAIRAYANSDDESVTVNSYAGKEALERLERLSMLKSALWRRNSSRLDFARKSNVEPRFRAERVYALMGFFEHRIYPHFEETELQAFVRLSMANDNDRLVERMVSLLSLSQIPGNPRWYTETDELKANLWDIEPDIQVVGITGSHALVLGGCRAAAIRWRNFPFVVFATQRSFKRWIAHHLPYLFWLILVAGILLEVINNLNAAATDSTFQYPSGYGILVNSPAAQQIPGTVALVIIAPILMLFAPLLIVYGNSGRIVHAQPWLVGVKGLISAEQASELMYGGAVFALPRTSYSPSGTLFSQTEKGQFRRGDPAQLKALDAEAEDNLYTLVDTKSAMIYYFRAERPPTVCLYTGRESGMGRFVLCSERCTENELYKETVIRMPWHISQSMHACDWVALA